MKTNRGKAFEKAFKYSLDNSNLNAITIRLPDQVSGYKGSSNICDFLVYTYPNLFGFECKSCYGKSFPLHNITQTQWNGLLELEYSKGAFGGIVVWFIDYDLTVYIPLHHLAEYVVRTGKKSISIDAIKYIPHIALQGRKKRVFYEYDVDNLVLMLRAGMYHKEV